MSSHGYEFVAQPTYIVELTLDTDRMWRRIDLKSRQKVRKAQRAGLAAKESSDASMTDEYYDRFMEVMTRKGLFAPYDRERHRLMFKRSYPKDMLLGLQVLNPEGQSIPSALFPHDDETIYYWVAASRMTGRQYSTNNLMHWSVMEGAINHGLSSYNMGGRGKFKQKFGGALVPIRRWQKYYSRVARWGPAAYARHDGMRIKMLGRWDRLFQLSAEAG
jgi:lipid II:glycine glycyltransferase (peptidoglycan interpeptide bridge formation enzyme)